MSRRKRSQKQEVVPEDEDLDRFAGSSDEEEDLEKTRDRTEHDAGDEEESPDKEEENVNSSDDDDVPEEDEYPANDKDEEDSDSEPEEGLDSSAKMSNVMARILGASTNSAATSSVVLAKTTTPLQRMQQKEKEEMKALKEKRQSNRERNLTALHIPLSVATTNTIEDGRLSVTKELEQERFHRRVATRGVVALFNAISKHQKSTEEDKTTTKRKEATKLTKHGFMDKIKSTAAAASTGKAKNMEDPDKVRENGKEVVQWDALKEDYMLNSKKNWDQESSDEASSVEDEPADLKELDQARKKKRRISSKE